MKLRIHISFGREQWWRCGHRGRWRARARYGRQPALSRKHLIFSGAFSYFQRGCPGSVPKCSSEPVGEGVVLSVSSFTQQENKQTKTHPKTNKKPTKTKHWGAWGMALLVSQWTRATWQARPAPRSCCCVEGKTIATPPPCVPAVFTTAVSRPLPIVSLSPLEVSEIPNFQSSFSMFSIYVGIL